MKTIYFEQEGEKSSTVQEPEAEDLHSKESTI